MAVPIQNVYYLLCYPWDRLDALDTVDVGALSGDRIENLLGKVLHDGVSHLMRRGLDRGYLSVEQEGRHLRGKVLLVETVQRLLLQQGRVACRMDELSHDVPHNQVLKAAMRELARLPGIDRELGWTSRTCVVVWTMCLMSNSAPQHSEASNLARISCGTPS